ncbi:MAG: 50S ribosomal protein L18 [Candidatus Schekmanbacteria bacterium RIFCSPHIGHO2_02_FULL_38_11]|uniref:Large ribosomal subunit protein uL18 n=1 Tax=Candidatus Schekmanbacteria bacterium RIFCSPLOWO2_12_FULL_38_15 TaxID=1817883 RepID=A0A1F7SLL3_9BACT|nr:MAG: 50S ribosomal protein L18 [Candidatus Schekmanbacteria bacterium GWA2_38_9]OGL50076.1 MAG: 50S ribosomal protein L18 [Candidatus Schekmanbacteria bacterium RIFCSPLOWO2_02_FULL_38_14]OGL50518.1 MAG: 50S ribosomal protein L18 [Candidatus Schekmanbacteria bacterium RIFCSPHIGHO2_02_FULL_38_11]OGL54675.1 MAG: 50S ribosomal protein L18 [Candidatus Schekmanbacteria bacterium RIFCSPLOWO2_12_FULL_38_15]
MHLAIRLNRREARVSRHKKIRKKIRGTSEVPRLSVFKSSRHLYAQIINDDNGNTMAAFSTLKPEFKEKMKKSSTIESAKVVGEFIAEQAKKLGIEKVRFDRGGFPFHGRIKALADAAREKGLKF